ncbi:class I SAM-dependent methyltransferase family protein [Micromonospora sp. WMMD1155]|uniref:class I SAM-dependent methyltransferase family protein n=1 Tax=Micromonospora sp. WMMD1155 TaxID=3016094 RepID=UPI00249A2DB7|nr:class I SAM-dependent methyltransferase family protein [Micromonospora sp. WMMD1155]WFE51707.1 class I SAM-dependent methyltransferase family protein [Micromonospora sp. WMMD1155]
MTAQTHWQAWHEPYADETSPLSRRLRLVQQHIASWLEQRSDERLTVVSVCAGQGRDLIGVLASRSDAQRVRATLLENDAGNVAAAQAAAAQAGLSTIVIRQADAGRLSSYAGMVPADLLLMVGVFGNISDADVERTLAALPQVCAEGATVIWTRTRREPDLTPAVREWFRAAGFVEQAFHAPDDVRFSVGVHRFASAPRPLEPSGTLFTFLR